MLELEHLGLIDFENRGTRRPRQSVSAAIQSSGQDDRLRRCGRGEEVVEEPGTHAHPLGVERRSTG
jgi:hypothetical protein